MYDMKSELQIRIDRQTDDKWRVSISLDGSSRFAGIQSSKVKAIKRVMEACTDIIIDEI